MDKETMQEYGKFGAEWTVEDDCLTTLTVQRRSDEVTVDIGGHTIYLDYAQACQLAVIVSECATATQRFADFYAGGR